MAGIKGELAIDTAALKRDIESFGERIAKLSKKKKNMESEVLSLQTMWRGRANAAFSDQFGVDCRKLEAMIDFLDQYRKKLSEAMDEYNRCDSQVYDIVKNIMI